MHEFFITVVELWADLGACTPEGTENDEALIRRTTKVLGSAIAKCMGQHGLKAVIEIDHNGVKASVEAGNSKSVQVSSTVI